MGPIKYQWAMEYTGKEECKSELRRDLPSKAEGTTPKRQLQKASGRSCAVANPMEHLMDGRRC